VLAQHAAHGKGMLEDIRFERHFRTPYS